VAFKWHNSESRCVTKVVETKYGVHKWQSLESRYYVTQVVEAKYGGL
jgi:hypothetical protein